MKDNGARSMNKGKIISFEECKNRFNEVQFGDVEGVLDQMERLHERVTTIQKIVDPDVMLEWCGIR